MIIYRCDVCETTKPDRTSLSHLRMLPMGWRQREARVPYMVKRSPYKHAEVTVHVCSETCAKEYDLLEAEEVGLAWSQHSVDPEEVPEVRPLKRRST